MADDQPDQPPPGDRPLGPGEPRSFANGRYVVRRRLGAGNFATVYLAHDERLDVAVAIKLLSDRWSWEPEARVRFVQEARMLRSLNDPYVVQIRDIAETEDGRPYLVMDYADRGTLEQRLSEHAQRGGPVVTADLRAVARALRDALQPLHARRIAHRDVKPSNLLLASLPPGQTSLATNLFRDDERLLLGDLGLAKDLTVGSGLTVGAGTAGYMAPEQSRPGTTIDTRTDIYAASALLAEVASGQPPDPLRRFRDGVLEGGSPLPANIVEPLRTVLTHGLDTDPLKRPATHRVVGRDRRGHGGHHTHRRAGRRATARDRHRAGARGPARRRKPTRRPRGSRPRADAGRAGCTRGRGHRRRRAARPRRR